MILVAFSTPPATVALVNAARHGDGPTERRIADVRRTDDHRRTVDPREHERGRTAATGPSRPGLSGTAGTVPASRAATAASDGRLVFTSKRDGNGEIYVMDPDGGRVRRLTNSAFDEGGPAWSPDGKRIAFTSNRGGRYEIYVMRADGSGVRRVGGVSANEDASRVAWSPDGKRLAFNSTSSKPIDWHTIWLINDDGSGLRQLTSDGDESAPVWSPDGKRIAYWSPTSDPTISVYDFDDGFSFQLGPGAWPAWSPDGRHIVFVDVPNGTDHQRLRTMDPDGTHVRTVYTTDNEWLGHPAYSRRADVIVFDRDPDGHEVCVAEWRKDFWGDPAFTPCTTEDGPLRAALWQIRSDGTGLHRLSASTGDDYDASFMR